MSDSCRSDYIIESNTELVERCFDQLVKLELYLPLLSQMKRRNTLRKRVLNKLDNRRELI